MLSPALPPRLSLDQAHDGTGPGHGISDGQGLVPQFDGPLHVRFGVIGPARYRLNEINCTQISVGQSIPGIEINGFHEILPRQRVIGPREDLKMLPPFHKIFVGFHIFGGISPNTGLLPTNQFYIQLGYDLTCDLILDGEYVL